MRYLPAVVAALLVASVQAQEYARYQGTWRGSFLFYVAQADSSAQGPPAVFDGTLQIDGAGIVRGEVPEAACRIAGSGIDFVSQANATLELDLNGCRDARFNGHFTGRLINNPILRYASLRLNSMRSLDAGMAQISAIIRR